MAPGFAFNIPFGDGNCLLPLVSDVSNHVPVVVGDGAVVDYRLPTLIDTLWKLYIVDLCVFQFTVVLSSV